VSAGGQLILNLRVPNLSCGWKTWPSSCKYGKYMAAAISPHTGANSQVPT